jgi:hypothetical protein
MSIFDQNRLKMSNKNYELLIEMRNTIIDYLQDEADVNSKALAAYEEKPFQDSDRELNRMREIEAIKLRDRVNQINRHISVIKRMFPTKK